MTINLKKIGALIKITILGSTEYSANPIYESANNVRFTDLSNGTFDLSVGGQINGLYAYSFSALAIADILFDGVAATDTADFESKLSAVFPNATSGSGGSGTVSTQTNDTAAFAALTNGTFAFYEVGGSISFYGKTSTGTEQKLTIPNF